VIIPFLSDFLRQRHWRYDQVGVAVALGGFGTFLMQTPAGILIDRIRSRRLLLGFLSLVLGLAYGVLPGVASNQVWVYCALLLAGMANAFFAPLLGTLAVALVGRARLAATLGVNQCCNHAGNIAAALVALVLVKALGISWVFYVTILISALASGSLLLIRKGELHEDLVQTHTDSHIVRRLLRQPEVRILLLSVALFHLANAPMMPLVALYLKHLGGGDDQVAGVVLIAQAVMVPVAYLTGRYCTRLGRKPVFAVAFLVLPLRILLDSATKNPKTLLAIQSLDGIGAGIYGVVIVLIRRYVCRNCQTYFTSATLRTDRYQKKRRVNFALHRLYSSGLSQRRLALVLKLNRKTVVRKIRFLGQQERAMQAIFLRNHYKDRPLTQIQFDDLETSEHTKCKPLSVTLAVDPETRKILHFQVAPMPARGLLAEVSRRKYGYRADERPRAWDRLMAELVPYVAPNGRWTSDENPHYPPHLRRHHPDATHTRVRGGRGAITGQGELKKLRFDPLFSLNHTCAMLRANMNRLFRRTWCTTKNRQGLIDHLSLYVSFHNRVLTPSRSAFKGGS
jgi:MFS family permease